MKLFLRLFCFPMLVALLPLYTSAAQTTTYRVFFTDKGPGEFVPGSALYTRTLELLTPRALDRRRKVLPDDALLTLQDAPVYEGYLREIEKGTTRVLLTLRWANYAVVESDTVDSAAIAALPFVRAVRPTSSRHSVLAADQRQTQTLSPVFDIASTGTNCGAFRYGPSYEQAASINVPAVHALGITGYNVLIGFLDSGFRWKTQPTISGADVEAEYDFIFGDSVTANQQPDIASQDDHGTLVFSTVAGFLQDTLIGIAPNARFLLGKTEDIRSEKHLEEDNYAAGVEWMESRGADIITSSLGYFDFDSDQEDYEYDQLDGRSTVVARAVNHAVGLGVVCITAAGNEGVRADRGTIISPGDADSAITVAAALRNQQSVASFSSRGPRGDGRRKPDIAAQGTMVFCADASNQPVIKTSNGTSLATPLIAGGTALVLSVFPELRPWEVRDLLYSTASQADAPDTALGYGLADIFRAISSRGIAIAPDIAVYHSAYRTPEQIRVVARMISSNFSLSARLFVRYAHEASFREYPMFASSVPYAMFTDLPVEEFRGKPAEAYVWADNGMNTRRLPFHGDSILTIDPATTAIPCGTSADDLPYDFPGNIIEGVHPSVARRQDTEAITLALATPTAAELTVQVYSILGRRVFDLSLAQSATGMTTITVPISTLAAGTYFVQVVYNGAVHSHPFTVLP